MFDLGE